MAENNKNLFILIFDMQKFVKKTILFALFSIVGVLTVSILTYVYVYSSDDYYRVDPRDTLLIVGDSHTEAALDTRHLPGMQNLSYRGEPLFFTYYKLKRLLEVNDHLKHVVLGLSYHSLNEYQNSQYEKMLPDFHWMLDLKSFSSDRMDPKFFKIVANDMASRTYRFFVETLKGREFDILAGGYRHLDGRNVTAEIINERIAKLYFVEGTQEVQRPSQLQFGALDRILALCREKGVRLTLLNTPLHPDYLESVPQEVKARFEKLVGSITQEHFTYVRYLDFKNEIVDPDCFFDGDHLNYNGSTIFTEIFLENIKQAALAQNVRQ